MVVLTVPGRVLIIFRGLFFCAGALPQILINLFYCPFFLRKKKFVHFFFSSKRTEFRFIGTSSTKLNEPKKKRPEMTTSPRPCACYTSLIGANGLAEVGFAELAKDCPMERWRGFEIRAFRSVRAISGLPTLH
jgi:hypothetical protein